MGLQFYHTVDGTTPTPSSSTVTSGGTILISKSETLNAYATKAGSTDSAVASTTYQITGGDDGTIQDEAVSLDGLFGHAGPKSFSELGAVAFLTFGIVLG